MDFLRQQLAVLQERLGGLSASQKMLVAALAVIAVMAMLYSGRMASESDMVALTTAPLNPDQMNAAQASLAASGIKAEVSGTTIKVPADKRIAAMGALTFNNVLPAASASSALEAMLKESSLMSTGAKFDAQMNLARTVQIKAILNSWPDVSEAEVVLPERQRAGMINGPSATAAVSFKLPEDLVGGALRKRAQNAANFVASTVVGLKPENVTVSINGATFRQDSQFGGGDTNDLFELRRAYEAAEAQKLYRAFEDVKRGLIVSVTAEVDPDSMTKTTDAVDPTQKISLTDETTSEVTSSSGGGAGEDPGVRSNTSLAVKVAGGGGVSSKSEITKEHNTVDYTKSKTITNRSAGNAKVTAAFISVPRSYFVGGWNAINKGKAAEGAEFEKYATTQLESMRQIAATQMQFVGTDQARMSARMYDMVEPSPADLAGGPMLAAAGAGGGLSLMAGGHAKDIAVGVLALASLFMVGRMVKKSTPPAPEPLIPLDGDPMPIAPPPPKPKIVRGPNTLDGTEFVAGDVMEGGPVLMGQELDDSVLETSQMVEQVTGFVKDNPDMAAQLLKRWMNRE